MASPTEVDHNSDKKQIPQQTKILHKNSDEYMFDYPQKKISNKFSPTKREYVLPKLPDSSPNDSNKRSSKSGMKF